MHALQKPSITAAFLFAAHAFVAGPETTLADEPQPSQRTSRETPAATATYKAHSIVCSSNQTQFVTFMNQQVKPLDPEKVPREIYRDIWRIFQKSATKLDQFIISITKNSMTDDKLTEAITEKYDELQIENRNEINDYILENWPPPYSFTAQEVGRIDIRVDTQSHACADI